MIFHDMGLVGSIKSQVSFAKEPYKRDDILQKRPIILSILLFVATPYNVSPLQVLWGITGLFCKKALQKRRYSAKETYIPYNVYTVGHFPLKFLWGGFEEQTP